MGKFSRRGAFVQPTPPVCKKGPARFAPFIFITLEAIVTLEIQDGPEI